MGLIWWILPAVAGVIGLMLLFAGFGRLARLKPTTGLLRLVFGVGFLGLAGIVSFAGLNLQTYKRLTLERFAAKVSFAAVEDEPGAYIATIIMPDGEEFTAPSGNPLIFRGNEFSIGADVIKFKPYANMLGYDSIYRLSFMSSVNTNQFTTETVGKGELYRINFFSTGGQLISGQEPGFISMKDFAAVHGRRVGLEDGRYGSATYQPMGDGYAYEINITQDALISRPTAETKQLLQQARYPGYTFNEAGNE